jgi:hypothetical protein
LLVDPHAAAYKNQVKKSLWKRCGMWRKAKVFMAFAFLLGGFGMSVLHIKFFLQVLFSCVRKNNAVCNAVKLSEQSLLSPGES